MWYTIKDVMAILGVSRAKGYEVMRCMADELEKTKMPGSDRCYARPPAGKIQKSYFCQKFMFDVNECDRLLKQSKSIS